jgi:hypothetical protein
MNYDGVWLAVYTAEGSPFGSGTIILRDGKAVGGGLERRVLSS